MRFFVHEDCSTAGPCDETEARFGDIIYTRDGDDEMDPLAEGQEGVTQRVRMPLVHIPPSSVESTHSAHEAARHFLRLIALSLAVNDASQC